MAGPLTNYEAVQLFVERAVASQPKFVVTKNNAPAVVQICRRLDGIPLAIELAAALIKVLAVEQIAARLDDRFRLLTGGARTALPRHQTLRATMDWSYDLLSDSERTVLRRLSVFGGGWTLEAAEAICSGDGIEGAYVLNLQTGLVEKSLVVVETHGGEARYRLLETIRQYAQDRLLEAGEAEKVRKQHRDWYLKLVERAQPEIQGPKQTAWLERLETEHENLRAALEWSNTEEGRTEPGLRLAAALWDFWQVHGHFAEGRWWLQNMLARSRDSPAPVRAKALVGAAILAWRQSDYEAATMLLQESLALFRELDDLSGSGQALHLFGMIAEHEGDYDRARTLLAESLVLCRKSGDRRRIAISLNALGEVARCQCDYAAARASYEESLALRREVGEKRGVAVSLGNLGHVALYQGHTERAGVLFREALGLAWELMYKVGIAEYLGGLAGAAVAEGRATRAARLLAASEGLLNTLDARLEPPDRAEYERSIAAARAGLGDAAFAAAWTEGTVMTLEEAVEYAMMGDE